MIVTMDPPCVQCNSGAVLKFLITNVMNPSYINEGNQLIYIHTRTSAGIIESSEKLIALTPSDIQLSSYDRPVNGVVGD